MRVSSLHDFNWGIFHTFTFHTMQKPKQAFFSTHVCLSNGNASGCFSRALLGKTVFFAMKLFRSASVPYMREEVIDNLKLLYALINLLENLLVKDVIKFAFLRGTGGMIFKRVPWSC